MTELPHLGEIFDQLKRGAHLGPDDEPLFAALIARFEEYAEYFAPLGLRLVRHPREFFYFDPENSDSISDTLPRISIFSYILVDHAANQGRPIEEFIFAQNFLISSLPHFTLDRYAALLRQVDVYDSKDLENILKHMDRIGWVKWLGPDEFRFLRPFHRGFSRCLDLTQASTPPAESGPTVAESN